MKTYAAMRNQSRSSGFTLVEMMISVTLVLLMMTMFTSIFDIATSSVSTQRGISELDQRARLLSNTIRSDVSKRTFRYVFPYRPFEDPTLSPTPFGSRTGYVYISTNVATSGQDNILQFTVDSRMLQENPDTVEYFGAAAQLGPLAFAADRDMIANPNQPDADDGSLTPNGVSSSPAAEITYFIRNGDLYRRVMLLRNPLPVAGADLSPQPFSNSTSANYFLATNSFTRINQLTGGAITGVDDFWAHFDFSAVPVFDSSMPPVLQTASFVGIGAVSNEPGVANSLGLPSNRFGFNFVTGLSREHNEVGTGRAFIGRYLQAETSSPNFNWPINYSPACTVNGNPMDLANALTLQENGVIEEFATPSGATAIGLGGRGGTRASEDLLLANVHEFSVEVWDTRLKRYVTPANNDLGPVFDDTGTLLDTVRGDLHVDNRANTSFGPLGSAVPVANRVFDTWHPAVGAGNSAPLRPLRYYPPRVSDTPSGPSPDLMDDPANEIDTITKVAVNRGFWEASRTYVLGDVVFAVDADQFDFRLLNPPPSRPGDPPEPLVGWDWDGDGSFDWATDQVGVPKMDSQIAYRCVSAGTAGTSPPNWSVIPGQRFAESGTTPAVWEAVDNRHPIKSLRLKLQFLDPKSEGLRQLTLILPLTSEQ